MHVHRGPQWASRCWTLIGVCCACKTRSQSINKYWHLQILRSHFIPDQTGYCSNYRINSDAKLPSLFGNLSVPSLSLQITYTWSNVDTWECALGSVNKSGSPYKNFIDRSCKRATLGRGSAVQLRLLLRGVNNHQLTNSWLTYRHKPGGKRPGSKKLV